MKLLTLLVLCCWITNAFSQTPLNLNGASVKTSSTPAGKYYYGNANEPARAIEFKPGTVTPSDFLTNINSYFNIPTEFTFIEVATNVDQLGMRHRLLQQYYKGIPIEGLGYRVHEKDGFVKSVNGRAVKSISADMGIVLNERQAFSRAMQFVQTKDTTLREGKKLIVSEGFTFTAHSFAPAFQFDIDVSLAEQWRVSIDARDGQLINKVNLVNSCFKHKAEPPGSGIGTTNYYGNQPLKVEVYENGSSRLFGLTKNGGTIQTKSFAHESIISLLLFFEFSEAYDIYSGSNTYDAPYQKPAVSAHWAAEQVYEYYFINHNRRSYDNVGSPILSYVNVDQNMNNAFWTHNLLAFGDGSNNNPLVELDVVAHEFTHGVTQYEAGLNYFYEPGALNESFSDIMAKAAEFYTFGDTATWQLAKHYQPGGLRDFSNPNLKGQADTYKGNLWVIGSEDYGGVHYNSGVQNFWFYLLSEGGSGVNDVNESYNVSPIGIEAAAKITYRNLTEYMGQFSNYLDSRIGSMLAAADLYGENSAIQKEVDKAWDAVGVIDEPIIENLTIYDITGTTAKVKGSLEPRGTVVKYHFEYGTTPALGTSSPVYDYNGSVDGIVTGLQSNTKYYFRLVGTNEHGDSFMDKEFKTISLAPLVKIKQTVDVTETSAVLPAKLNPNSLSTSFYFEYGTTTALGSVTPSYSAGDTTEYIDVSAAVTNLEPQKKYYYRLVASNGFASSASGMATFFTGNKPVISSFTPSSGDVGTEITIIGNNFNPVPEKNIVSFGATRAGVVSSSPFEIKVIVPKGASLSTLSVLNDESALIGTSSEEFIPTFTDTFNKNNLQLRVGLNDPYVYNALVEDMDGDGRPDIVTRHYLGYSVFLNVNEGGDITSDSFMRSTFPFEYRWNFDLVDIDGNGLKDIVTQTQDAILIYPNLSVQGYVFFGSPVEFPLSNHSQLVFGDFDGDGHIDIAATKYIDYLGYRILTVIRNGNIRGNLAGDNFVKVFSKEFPYYVDHLYCSDLNKDGLPEIIAGIMDQDLMVVMKNSSSPGNFVFEENVIEDKVKGRWDGYAFTDYDNDGLKDIAIHSPMAESKVSLVRNSSTAQQIIFEPPVDLSATYIGGVIKSGDIDGNGKTDLLLSTKKRKLIFLQNQTKGEQLTADSFTEFARFGLEVRENEHLESTLVVNDLNGDGRPEVIRVHDYFYYPHDGFLMEIWQNAESICIDPSLVTVVPGKWSAKIVLPPNTKFDDFEISYGYKGSDYWIQIYSEDISYLSPSYQYQLRVRSKCYEEFSDYVYTDFSVSCANVNSFAISHIGIHEVTLEADNISNYTIEYSLANKNEWILVPQYENTIRNLLSGTSYDLRYRANCNTTNDFYYKQFTTGCAPLTDLWVTDIKYNSAMIFTNAPGNGLIEYSSDNANWIIVGNSGFAYPLLPATQYHVRALATCGDAVSTYIFKTFVTPCPEVSLITITNISPYSAVVNWIDESLTDSYTLIYSPATGEKQTIKTNESSVLLKNLQPGTRYNVEVAPECSGKPLYVSKFFATTCFAPFNLSVANITETSADLSWSSSFSGSQYTVDYNAGGTPWMTATTFDTFYQLKDLRPGTEYEARTHISCTSVIPPFASVRFQTELYDETTYGPNPTDNLVTIRPSVDLIGNPFSIFDSAGRTIADGEVNDYTFDFSNYLPGVYTLVIKGEDPIKIVKH